MSDSQIFSTFISDFQQLNMATIPQVKVIPDGYFTLTRQILLLTSRYERRMELIKEAANLLLSFSKCDSIEIWMKKDDHYQFIEVAQIDKDSFRFDVKPFFYNEKDGSMNISQNQTALVRLSREVILGHKDPASPFFTQHGSYWTARNLSKTCKSLILIPLVHGKKHIGLIRFQSGQSNFFNKTDIELYVHISPAFTSAILNQQIQEALNERIKELTCLYGIAKITEPINRPLDEIFHDILKLLPPAWQYPDITCGKIIFNGHSYATRDVQIYADKQVAPLIVAGKKRGSVEVMYLEKMPSLDEGPFLKEERSLINAIAENVAMIIECKEAAEERSKLQLQLRHADRLATIGQLTAGVVHELNEPLGNILGLAQLASKIPKLPKQVAEDLNRIITISLDAREIIKQLMIFARQKKPEKTMVDLNVIVKKGLRFFESLCAKEGIELIRSLSSKVPEFIADQTQIQQVLVNLITNAIQAMPRGGKLTIRTEAAENHVSLIIEDTGTGISDEVKKQMFIPFFTTKEVGKGTGIGLSVVHGVITSHNGTIKVESKIGEGTRFEVQIPLR